MLNFGAGIWRKIFLICIVSFAVIVILLERSNNSQIVNLVNEEADACRRQVESLVTQLTVVNSHRKKLDEAMLKQQIQANEAVHGLNSKLTAKEQEYAELNGKYETCIESKGSINNDVKDESVSPLKIENDQQKKEIMALREELEKTKKEQSTAAQKLADGDQNVVLLHPPEEHKGYADGDTVHFHRQLPNSANLEFRRNDEPIPIPQILKQDDLEKVIAKEKHARQLGRVKADGREEAEVMDYQQNKKPDNAEQDYKQME